MSNSGGLGSIDHPGFVNIDGVDRPHVHYVQSLVRLDRFHDSTVAFIYTSHTLEHFPYATTVETLKEWRRTLIPRGKLCISVPNFDRILDLYRLSGSDVDEILPPLFGGRDYPFNFHYRAFDQQSLTKLLIQAGFSSVQVWAHGSDEFHNLRDWSGRFVAANGHSVQISLNLEATK